MKYLTLVVALLAFVLAPAAAAHDATSPTRGLELVHRTDHAVASLRSCERELGRPMFPKRKTYARRVAARARSLQLWRARADRACDRVRYLNALPPRAIVHVFSPLGIDDVMIALDVAGDEGSGVDWSLSPSSWIKPFCTGSQNGQYLGCFQMGDWARSTYGHGDTALEQARAARAYVLDAGGWCSGWTATANHCGGVD